MLVLEGFDFWCLCSCPIHMYVVYNFVHQNSETWYFSRLSCTNVTALIVNRRQVHQSAGNDKWHQIQVQNTVTWLLQSNLKWSTRLAPRKVSTLKKSQCGTISKLSRTSSVSGCCPSTSCWPWQPVRSGWSWTQKNLQDFPGVNADLTENSFIHLRNCLFYLEYFPLRSR